VQVRACWGEVVFCGPFPWPCGSLARGCRTWLLRTAVAQLGSAAQLGSGPMMLCTTQQATAGVNTGAS
jgi:hypothetical protein